MQMEYLFHKYDMHRILQNLAEKLQKHIDALPVEHLAPSQEQDTLSRLAKEYTIYELVLSPERTTIEQREAQVDVRNDPMRSILDRSRPTNVPGFTIRYYVPYVGDKWLWETQGSQL